MSLSLKKNNSSNQILHASISQNSMAFCCYCSTAICKPSIENCVGIKSTLNTMEKDFVMPYVLRTIRVKTQQIILPDAPKVYELPTRKWRMQLFILDEEGNEKLATLFDHVTYHLHPTFERPIRKLTEPPFTLDEQGWGEFELKIIAKVKFCATTYTFHHELSFDDNAYNVDYEGKFPYHQTKLREELLKSGNVPIYNEDEISLGQVTNLQRAINLISVSDVDTIQKVINTIVTFPPVSEEIAKRRHQGDDIVILLSQIPNQLLNKICRLVEASSVAS